MCQVSYRQPVTLARSLKSIYFYFKCFRFATLSDKACLLVASLCAISSGVLVPFAMIFFGDVTGAMVDYATATNKIISEDDKEKLIETLRHEVGLYVSRALVVVVLVIALLYLSVVLYNYSAVRQIYKMRTMFLEKILNQDIEWFDRNSSGDFATIFTQNISKIEDGIGEKLGLFLFSIAYFLTGLIISLYEGWKLALVAMVPLPLSTTIMFIITKVASKFSKAELEAYDEAGAVALEAIGSIKTVVAFNGQDKESKLYKNHLVQAKRNNITRCIFNSSNNFVLWFLIFGCYSLTFWYGVQLVVDDRGLPGSERTYTPSTLATIFFSTVGATWYFGMAAPLLEAFAAARAAAQKVFFVLDSVPKINKIKEKGRKLYKFQTRIKFDEVYFSYPTRPEVKVLWGFDLQINIGETVALVGASGCGKSTCIQLLQRFYDPNMGKVTIDDLDIKEMSLVWLREKIAVVTQEASLFSTTVAENIRLGKEGALQEEIEAAAKKARVHDFILSLPNGYETVIGERGCQLSAGQKQKLAIARALIRKPQILLLDEATSALDASSDQELQAALDSISGECTVVVVAHRLSTVRKAKKIVLIDGGRVREIGSHVELMGKRGAYYNLVHSQGFTDTSYSATPLTKLPLFSEFVSLKLFGTFPEIQNILKQAHPPMYQFVPEKENADIDEQPEDQNVEKTFLKVMKLCEPDWLLITIGCLSSVVKGAAYPVNGWLFGSIIGILYLEDNAELLAENNSLCLYFVVLALVIGGAIFLQLLTFGVAGEQLTLKVRLMMFRAVLRQEMGWFDKKDNAAGALCTRLATDPPKIQGVAGVHIGTVLNFLAIVVIAFAICFHHEWRLTLVLLLVFPLIFLSVYLEQNFLQRDALNNHLMLEKTSKLAVEAIGSIRTVASLGCEQVFLDLFVKELMPFQSVAYRKSHIRGVVLGMAKTLRIVSYVVGMAYGGKLIMDGEAEYGAVFKVCEIMSISSWAIGTTLALPPNFQEALNAAARISSLLERKPLVRNSSKAVRHTWREGNVEYTDLFFSYPTRPSIPVLNGLNLSVMQGKTIALVGASGTGKSTVIRLLERFYDPAGGEITVDGVATRTMRLEQMRAQLGIVSQESNLFDRSVAENIAYGAVDEEDAQMEKVVEAAKAANIHAFVASLPMGYETRVGAKGSQISGGQKQRIALARALIRNPKILLLDEATSSLDNETEKIVQEALDVARKGRTCIMIAHRLSTVENADVICVLEKGMVAEMGNHEELLARRGLYYDFYKLQSVRK